MDGIKTKFGHIDTIEFKVKCFGEYNNDLVCRINMLKVNTLVKILNMNKVAIHFYIFGLTMED